MAAYLIRRAFQMMIVVLLATLAIYVLLNVAPGGPLSGLRLAADQKTRVSEADIARLEAYLGLDKPMALRYITWLIGDDWLGANWVYVGLGQYKELQLARDGKPLAKIDRNTGEVMNVYNSYRFWADPGVANLNPGYRLWVKGEQVEPGKFVANEIQVKPPTTARPPDDVSIAGNIVSQSGWEMVIQDLNLRKFTVEANEATMFTFPAGEGKPRPADGTWLNISWLTGPGGLLSQYSGMHGNTEGMLRMDFGFSWKLAPGQPVSGLIMSRLGNTLTLMATAV